MVCGELAPRHGVAMAGADTGTWLAPDGATAPEPEDEGDDAIEEVEQRLLPASRHGGTHLTAGAQRARRLVGLALGGLLLLAAALLGVWTSAGSGSAGSSGRRSRTEQHSFLQADADPSMSCREGSCAEKLCIYDPDCPDKIGCNAGEQEMCRFCGFAFFEACPITTTTPRATTSTSSSWGCSIHNMAACAGFTTATREALPPWAAAAVDVPPPPEASPQPSERPTSTLTTTRTALPVTQTSTATTTTTWTTTWSRTTTLTVTQTATITPMPTSSSTDTFTQTRTTTSTRTSSTSTSATSTLTSSSETRTTTSTTTTLTTSTTRTSTSTSTSTSSPYYDVVSFSLVLQNLDYATITGDTSLERHFLQRIKETTAADLGAGVRPEDVDVALSAGSVRVNVDVRPPHGQSADVLKDALESGTEPVAALRQALRGDARIAAAATGTLVISYLKPPRIVKRPLPSAGARSGPDLSTDLLIVATVASLLLVILIALAAAVLHRRSAGPAESPEGISARNLGNGCSETKDSFALAEATKSSYTALQTQEEYMSDTTTSPSYSARVSYREDAFFHDRDAARYRASCRAELTSLRRSVQAASEASATSVLTEDPFAEVFQAADRASGHGSFTPEQIDLHARPEVAQVSEMSGCSPEIAAVVLCQHDWNVQRSVESAIAGRLFPPAAPRSPTSLRFSATSSRGQDRLTSAQQQKVDHLAKLAKCPQERAFEALRECGWSDQEALQQLLTDAPR